MPLQMKVHEATKLRAELKETIKRASNLRPIADDVLDELESQNQHLNFNRNHPTSILEPTATGARIGAREPRQSYGELLELDERPVATIIKAWFVCGLK